MKRALSVFAFACFLGIPFHLFASSTVINSSGQQLLSIFDGLKPNPIAPSALANGGQSQSAVVGRLTPRLSGVTPGFFIIEGGNCPGGEACSGGFAQINSVPGGCDAGDGEECDINNFSLNIQAGCAAGVQNIYCGVNCCVSAITCNNPRNCAR